MQSAILRGSDFPVLGKIGAVALHPGCAAAISRGRFPKGYPHVDPNEDAAIIIASDAVTLLAVADGHSGFEAADAAIEAVAGSAETLLADRSDAALQELARSVRAAIGDVVARLAPPRSASRTALSVAVVAGNTLRAWTAGDTVVSVLRGDRARVLHGTAPFLGSREGTLPRVEEVSLDPGDLVAVASDGLTDFLGRDWPDHLAALSADTCETFVRDAVEAAFAGGAGDNVTVAALRVP